MAVGTQPELEAVKGWKLPPRIVRVLGDPRFRVEGQLLALLPLGDGTTWTVEEPGTVRQWNTRDGRELSRQELSDLEMLWSLGGDGPRLASAADDLTLWDVKTGAAVKTIRQPAWVTALAFRPAGDLLATGHDDGRIRLWDAAGGKLIREWRQGKAPVSALAFSPDGQRLAAGLEDRSVALLDVIHGASLAVLKGHTDRISGIAWHPGNRHLATASWDTTARLWDEEQGEQVFILNGQGEQVNAVAFSPDGKMLASADSDAVIWVWEPFAGKVLQQLRGHLGEVTQLAYTSDGKYLLSGGGDGRLILWDVKSGENVLHSMGDSSFTSRIRLSPRQDQVAAILGGRNVQVWDTLLGKQLGVLDLMPSNATALTYFGGPGGEALLATGHEDGRLLLWDSATFQLKGSCHEHTSRITSLAVDDAGLRLASGGSVDGYVYLWARDKSDPVLLIPGATEGCTVESLAFIPRTALLAAGGIDWKSSGQEGNLCLWDLQTPSKVASVKSGCMALAARPDGQQLAAASLEDSICLYELPALNLGCELVGHSGLVTGLAYTEDGKFLISTGEDGTVRVWDVAAGKEMHVLETEVSLRDLAINPDGRFVYTANANATAFVIDLKRGN